MKKTKQFLAMLLTLILCVGEISSTGLKVSAAGEEKDTTENVIEVVTEEDIEEQEEPFDGAIPGATGTGTAEDPLVVDNLTELKQALQADESLYIVVNNFPGKIYLYGSNGDYKANGPVIHQHGTKYLEVNCDMSFSQGDIATDMNGLIYVDGSLTLSGSGSITCDFYGTGYDSVLYTSSSGNLTILDDITIKSGGVDKDSFGIGIRNSGGRVTVFGGTFYSDNEDYDVNLSHGPYVYRDGTTNIFGGKFITADEDDSRYSRYDFGLVIDKSANVKVNICGGIYEGISWLGKGEGKISDLLSPNCTLYYISNGEPCNSAFKTILDKVEVKSPSVKVFFDSDGFGAASPSVEVKVGEKVTKPTDPVCEGYSFKGWFTDPAYKKAYDFSSKVNKNTILFAKWEQDKYYTVSFDLNGIGGTPPQNQRIKEGNCAVRPDDPIAEGYVFKGWYSGGVPFDFSKPINNDITLYAMWEKDITVYDLWVGGNQVTEDNMGSIPCDSGTASYDPSTNTLTFKDAKISNGYEYNTSSKRTAGVYAKGSNLTIKGDLTVDGTTIKDAICVEDTAANGNKLILDGDITVKGDYGISTRYTGVEINGGTLDIDAVTTAVKAGAPVSLGTGMKVLSPEGAEFKKSAYGDVYYLFESADSNVQVKTATIGSSDTETYTVTFDLNGKEGATPGPQTVEKGKTASKPSDPSADGFVFVAWCTDKEGKNVYDFTTPVTADITLYAKWEKAEEPAPIPDPLDGGRSALDPVPELIPGVTTELYLVKGQKFNIGQGWYIDKADKDSKKKVSISKKGAFKAKAEGEAVIKCGSGATAWEVKLHISKPKMEKKSLKIQLETATDVKQEQIAFNYDKINLNVLWYSSNPDVVTVDDTGKVTTVGKGSSKVTAYINGSAYTCTVSVKEKEGLQKRTLHVAKDASKTISIKGLKKPEWKTSEEGIVEIKKNKVTGIKAGTADLSFTQGDITYTVTVIVEDLGMSGTGLKPGKTNKYTIDELKIGDATKLSFAGVEQDVVFKSSKPDIAFIDEDLNVVIRGKGKAKFTAKINGKPVTITVNVK